MDLKHFKTVRHIQVIKSSPLILKLEKGGPEILLYVFRVTEQVGLVFC